MWPVLVTRRDPLPEAEARDGEAGKMEKYFSEAPGEGGCSRLGGILPFCPAHACGIASRYARVETFMPRAYVMGWRIRFDFTPAAFFCYEVCPTSGPGT